MLELSQLQPVSGILFICETPERLRGLENVTSSFIHKAANSEYQFGVNCHFNVLLADKKLFVLANS